MNAFSSDNERLEPRSTALVVTANFSSPSGSNIPMRTLQKCWKNTQQQQNKQHKAKEIKGGQEGEREERKRRRQGADGDKE